MNTVSIMRFALTGAMATGLFFLLGLAGALVPIGPLTHMYSRLFTGAPVATAIALAQGLCWSLALGLIAGSCIALFYNFLAPFERSREANTQDAMLQPKGA